MAQWLIDGFEISECHDSDAPAFIAVLLHHGSTLPLVSDDETVEVEVDPVFHAALSTIFTPV